jgi:hypothetical protein
MGERWQGRPLGHGNKITKAVREIAQDFVNDPEYRALLKARIACGEAPGMEKLLWHYAYGRPKMQVEVTADTTVEKIVREIVDPTPKHEAPAPRHEVEPDSIH